MSSSSGTGDGQVRRARRAVAVIFAVHGALSGTFATRIPWIRDELGLSTGWLGFALVFGTVGAALSMPWAAWLTHRLGARSALRWLAAAACAGLALPALSPGLGWLCAAVLLYGAGLGSCDVAMNAQGVEVERRYARSVMSGLHGLWSVGTLLGGGVGVFATHRGLDARLHLAVMAALLLAVSVAAVHWTLDVRAEPTAKGPGRRFARPSPTVLAIGLVGFCAVFAEGASMDWSAIYLRDVTHAAPWLAAAAYTAFACAMAVARLVGDMVVRRFGPVPTVRAGGLLTTLGGVLVVFAGSAAVAMVGFGLIGVGIAVVVPLCFAAAGRTTTAAPGQAIAAVATLAYASGLAAPAAVGWIAQVASLPASFALVTVLALGLVLGAGVLRTDHPASERHVPETAPGDKDEPVSRQA